MHQVQQLTHIKLHNTPCTTLGCLHLLFKYAFTFLFCTRTVGEQITEDTFVVGSLERVWQTSTTLTVEERQVVGAVSKMWLFSRAVINGVELQSELCKRTTSRNNFTAIIEIRGKSHYGSIVIFVKYEAKCTRMSCQNDKCSCSLPFHYIALVKKMAKHPSQLPFYQGMQVIKHIRRVTIADNIIVVPISSIKQKCMWIETDATSTYVCHLPNSFEKD